MKTFAQLREETSSYETHKRRVQKIPKGSSVSFTHSQTGKKVTGSYKGLKQMGGRSYAHVEHGDGATFVPVHQIHESVQIDEISTEKMRDYQDKASHDLSKSIDKALTAGSSRKADPHYDRALKRELGIDRADRLISKKKVNEATEEAPEHKWSNIASHRGLHQFYTSLNKKGDGWITQHNKGETTHHKTYQGVTDHIKKFVGPKESHIHTTDDRDPRAEKIFDRNDEGWKKHPLLKMKS